MHERVLAHVFPIDHVPGAQIEADVCQMTSKTPPLESPRYGNTRSRRLGQTAVVQFGLELVSKETRQGSGRTGLFERSQRPLT